MDLHERLRTMKMAIVEDDALLREAMVRYFRSKGCTVSGFADADSAMEAFGKESPAIVISDHFLPTPDGLKLLCRVGMQHPAALRILITAHPSPDVTRAAALAGIDEFILKPFGIEELEDSLRRVLNGRAERSPEPAGPAGSNAR